MFWSASHTSVSKSVSQGLHLWRKKWKIRLIIVESREWKPSVLSFKFINKVHQLLPLLGFLMNHRICLDKLINGQLRGAFSFALWIFSSPWLQTDHTQTRIKLWPDAGIRNSHCKLLCCHKEDCSKTGGTKSHVQIFYYLICTILSLKYFIANFDVETKQNEWTLWNKWHWQNSFLPCEYKKKKRY